MSIRPVNAFLVKVSGVLLLFASLPARSQQGEQNAPVPRAVDGRVDLTGVWIVSGSPDLPSDPDYLPEARKVYMQRKESGGKGDPEKACLPNGVVRIEPLPYKIVQTPKLVVMLSEGNTHSYRRFFLDGRPHDTDVEPNNWNGNSIGHWDGETLVVDTIGFNDRTWLDSTGKPHSEVLHVVERYRRPNLNQLEIAYVLEDTQAFSKPYSFTRTFTRVTDRDLREYFCAMDNFAGK